MEELWGTGGKVHGSEKLGDVLAGMQVSSDFEYSKPQEDTAKLQFVHRSPGR